MGLVDGGEFVVGLVYVMIGFVKVDGGGWNGACGFFGLWDWGGGVGDMMWKFYQSTMNRVVMISCLVIMFRFFASLTRARACHFLKPTPSLMYQNSRTLFD